MSNNRPQRSPAKNVGQASEPPNTLVASGEEPPKKKAFSDSMIDFDLNDLEGLSDTVTKVPMEPVLKNYQTNNNRIYNPPTTLPPPIHTARGRVTIDPADIPPAARPVNYATPQAGGQPRAQAPAPSAGKNDSHVLPADWQQQVQELIAYSVRMQLQQEIPLLMLQWTKQMQEQMVPQLQHQLIALMHRWHNNKQ